MAALALLAGPVAAVSLAPAGTAAAGASPTWQVVAPELSDPVAIAADQSRNVYAIEPGVSSVIEVSSNGQLTLIGSSIASPTALYVTPSGDVYVADSSTGSIDEITPDGTMTIATTAPDPSAGPIIALAVSSAGEIWFTQQASLTTTYYSSNGGTPAAFGTQLSSLGADAHGFVYGSTGGSVLKIAVDGSYTVLPPPSSIGVYGWGQIAVDAGGDIYNYNSTDGLSFAQGSSKVVFPYPSYDAVWNVAPNGNVVEAGTNAGCNPANPSNCKPGSWIESITPSLEISYAPMADLTGDLSLSTAPDGRIELNSGSCYLEVDAGGHEHPMPDTIDDTTGCAGTSQPDGWARGPDGGATPTTPYLQQYFVNNTSSTPSNDQLAEFTRDPNGVNALSDFGPQQSWGPIASNGTANVWAWTSIGTAIDEVAYPSGAVTTVGSVPGVEGLAVDTSGDVYALTDTSLVEIPQGGSPTTLVSTGLNDDGGIAFDAAGDLYVANGDEVDEYSDGGLTPLAGIVPGVTALGFDAQGDLYAYGKLGAEEYVGPDSPTAATGLAVTPGNDRLTLSWHAPASLGIGSLLGYTVTADAKGGGVGASCTTTGLTCVLKNSNSSSQYSNDDDYLLASHTYDIEVVTRTSAGISVSAPVAGVPIALPGAPVLKSAAVGSMLVKVRWDAPRSDGGSQITGYTATAKLGSASAKCKTTRTSCTITGLKNGNKYVVSVVATNAAGSSAHSNTKTVTPKA